MTTNFAVKKNISSLQVLKTLQILMEDNYTMAELVNKLNLGEKESIFNNSVVSKYINTCRYCGINIPKIHNRYILASVPFGMDLTSRELDLLSMLQNTVKNTMSHKQNIIIDKFITKLTKYSNKHIARIDKEAPKFSFELFSKAVMEKRIIIFMFRTGASMECIPLGIAESKTKTFFNVIYKGKEKLIRCERVAGIKITDKKFENGFEQDKSVVFKIKGKLMKRYTLKEDEQIISHDLPDNFVISSSENENRDALFSRLLRYDNLCEIIQPISAREDMKQIIDKMLENYGVTV